MNNEKWKHFPQSWQRILQSWIKGKAGASPLNVVPQLCCHWLPVYLQLKPMLKFNSREIQFNLGSCEEEEEEKERGWGRRGDVTTATTTKHKQNIYFFKGLGITSFAFSRFVTLFLQFWLKHLVRERNAPNWAHENFPAVTFKFCFVLFSAIVFF